MLEAGFDLRKWFTNSPELQKYIDDSEARRSGADVCAPLPTPNTDALRHVLGVLWDGLADEFVYDLEKIAVEAESLPLTKRSILSTSAKFYDPPGLISPIVVALKVLFQELCKDKRDWDDDIPELMCQKWLRYIEQLKVVQSIRVS